MDLKQIIITSSFNLKIKIICYFIFELLELALNIIDDTKVDFILNFLMKKYFLSSFNYYLKKINK